MMEDLYPKQKNVFYQALNLPIYIPVHGSANMMFTLLMASDLMKSENLLFADTQNPCYIPPRNMVAPLGDINTGNTYYNYYERMNPT